MAGEKRGPFWAVAISTVFGLGFTPKMPGTIGSLVGVFLYLPAFLLSEQRALLLVLGELAAVLLLAGLSVPRVLKATGLRDPSYIVVDEVAGMLCALSLVSPDFVRVMLAFGLFRLLDISKPFPVGRLERLPGALGVMADDVAAGFLAGALTLLVMRFV